MIGQKQNSGETISIYIGTPAVNLAINTWELLTLEHGIKPDGTVQSISEDSFSKMKEPSSFFTQTKSGKNVPKALLFDLDPFPVNEIRQGVFRSLFDSENLMNGKSPATIYSVAVQAGKAFNDKILDKIRKMADNCQNLESIMIYSSLAGGTGAGVTGLLLESLGELYERVDRIGVNFYPSKNMGQNHRFMDFNMGYSVLNVLEHLDASIALDNETIYNICEANFSGSQVYYSSVNRVIAQFISGLTAPNRLEGALKIGLGDIRDYLIPSPQLKFLVPSLAPLTSADKISQKEHTVYEVTNSIFSKGSSLIDCEAHKSSIIAGNLYYRGDVMPNELAKTLEEFEKTLKFTPASTRNFNVSLNYFPNMYVPGGDMGRYMRSCCSLVNGVEFMKVLGFLRERYGGKIKSNWHQQWLNKYDKDWELLGGLSKPLEKIEQTIEGYQKSESEGVEEI